MIIFLVFFSLFLAMFFAIFGILAFVVNQDYKEYGGGDE